MQVGGTDVPQRWSQMMSKLLHIAVVGAELGVVDGRHGTRAAAVHRVGIGTELRAAVALGASDPAAVREIEAGLPDVAANLAAAGGGVDAVATPAVGPEGAVAPAPVRPRWERPVHRVP